ncbi:MAG: S8 family serine peptidase [Mycobacteriales bacterium]
MLPLSVAVLALAALLSATAAQATAPVGRGSAWTAGAHLDSGLKTIGSAAQQVVVSGRHSVAATAEAVRRLGGTVGKPLEMIGGVSARVPADRLVELSHDPAIGAVTANTTGRFSEFAYDDTTVASNFTKTTGANSAWNAGNLGAGVGVAVLDTGISSMNDFSGRIVYGPDLSGEGTTVDSFGHGTVMAGAIAGGGNDSAGQVGGAYVGVAPKATLVSVKVAGRNGVVDVATILQAMHWVSSYKDQFNIRVLNLSWGTRSTQDPAVDPLNYAVERLWRQGIVVVVAAGNSGNAAGTITKPGDDPLVITAGAYDDKGNLDATDDSLPVWSSRGPTAQGLTKPDLVSPGRTIITARSYGSYVEANNPKALISPSYIKGSGTSQAAAVTSGLAALVVAANPSYTPDQVKRVLTSTANPLAGKPANDQGAGRVNLAKALTADPGPAISQTGSSNGLGSIEASRGGYNVTANCAGTATLIKGEIDNRCEAWNGSTWTGSTWTGSTWTGSTWTGSTWTGSTWTGSTWTNAAWTGSTWTGGQWTGSTWTGSTWTGSTWTGSTWTGSTWTGSTWTGSTWTGSTWTTAEYDEFLTAFWGNRPGPGKRVAGENNDPASDSPR